LAYMNTNHEDFIGFAKYKSSILILYKSLLLFFFFTKMISLVIDRLCQHN
jgi:hypothetical protein